MLLEALKASVLAALLFVLLYVLYPPAAPENTTHGKPADLDAIDVGLFGVIIIGLLLILLFGFFENIRVVYTGLAAALLIYRTILYWIHGYILFMIDLCPVAQILLLFTLWNPKFLTDKNWRNAVFMILNGPIAGSTFLLSIKISLDNAEVFMSLFLHVGGQWLSFLIWWRIFEDKEGEKICSLFKNAMMKIYLEWYVFMGVFLTFQPFIPGISHMMTLYDWMAGSILGVDLMPRDWPFWKWAACAWAYVSIHAIMASYGMIMACLSYQYPSVHMTFAGVVLLAIVFRSVLHYVFAREHTLTIGLVEASVAGVIVAAVWMYKEKTREKADLEAAWAPRELSRSAAQE